MVDTPSKDLNFRAEARLPLVGICILTRFIASILNIVILKLH